MAILRTEPVGFDGTKTRFDALVDDTTDLTGLDYAGVGSLAYVREQDPHVYVKTSTGWEEIDSSGQAAEDDGGGES